MDSMKSDLLLNISLLLLLGSLSAGCHVHLGAERRIDD